MTLQKRTGEHAKAVVHVFRTGRDAASFIIRAWHEIARRGISSRGRFTVALSGGRTPAGLYDMLSNEAERSLWKDTHIFLADERFVPRDHPDSNYRLVREHLIVQAGSVHPVAAEGLSQEEGAARYEEEIRTFFDTHAYPPAFDLIMLGVGEDGHTASLFPGSPALKEKIRLICPVITDRMPHLRITMTLPVINSALNVIFFVTGRGKAQVMKEVLGKGSQLPAALVRPEQGALVHVLDEEAASLLDPETISRGTA
jgi:6-phosphogluconolactonase